MKSAALAHQALASAAVAELAADLAARGIPAEIIRGALLEYLGKAAAEGGSAAELANGLRDLADAIDATLALAHPRGRA